LDARKFVVANVGPIGCIPYQKTINNVAENECVSLPNQLAKQYNGQLRELLAELNDNLPGAKFCLANVYDLVYELINNYKHYGTHLSLSLSLCTATEMMFNIHDFASTIENFKKFVLLLLIQCL
jgi:GDSL-like Lipase/Acylhydrolase